MFHGFIRNPDGSFTTIDLPEMPNLEFLFVNTITDFGAVGFRAKAANDVLRSYILMPDGTLYEVRIPGSVITVVRNVNQDGSIVGYYDSADGRRHGFLGRPKTQPTGEGFGNIFSMHLSEGLNMLSVPLKPTVHMTARSLAVKTGATTVITLDAANQQFVGWTPDAPDDGFSIEGGKGYIINLPKARDIVFTGTAWINQMQVPTAPLATTPYQTWAFVVSGHLQGKTTFDGYQVTVRNLRTNNTITTSVRGDYFAAATADLARRSVVQVGDVIEVRVIGPNDNVESHTLSYNVTPESIVNAVLSIRLDSIGKPKLTQLLQNFPNPFNPETWIPYQLSEDSSVSVSIYNTTGKLIRTLPLGYQSAGFYNSRGRAAYWDGRNENGESVSSGVYFYQLQTGDHTELRRMVIVK
ncbi:T9SS type A sorting domain-containing protein [Candidatus Poribacteria bacterium]|nr:T9SS type A sorting domain-containing protein [Candidatus Poribacteria bacterium]